MSALIKEPNKKTFGRNAAKKKKKERKVWNIGIKQEQPVI